MCKSINNQNVAILEDSEAVICFFTDCMTERIHMKHFLAVARTQYDAKADINIVYVKLNKLDCVYTPYRVFILGKKFSGGLSPEN